jgi:hypothetical protein
VIRRKTFSEIHAAEIEAARKAASDLGAFKIEGSSYPHSSAAVEPTPPAPAVEVARRGAQPAQEERPAGFPPDECQCGGHIGWIDRGDHWDGTCHGPCRMPHFRNKQREPRSIADLIEGIDLLQRENKRLRSELNQAIAQRDIARAQRDEARATNGRMSP